VRHAGAEDTVPVDQSAVDGWSLIGDFAFASGADQSVHLGDNTGEPLATNTQIVADAVRLTRLDLPEETAAEAEEPRPEVPDGDDDIRDAQGGDGDTDGNGATVAEGGCGCTLAR
jgi:hypothetical protein